MPEDNMAGATAPAENLTFAQRKSAQLAEERAQRGHVEPVVPEALQDEPPSTPAESVEDVEQDPPQLDADDGEPRDASDDDPSALDEELPDDDAENGEDDNVDWQKRYSDLRAETESLMAGRQEATEEHAAAMSETLKLRFQLEDQLEEAKRRAEFLFNSASGNAEQYKNIDWSRVPPDKVQEVQQLAQAAMLQEQQAKQVFEQVKEQADSEKEQHYRREAEIAKERLRRTIPNWGNEVYGQIRDFSMKKGMPAEAFDRITDPVVIEALHAYWNLNTASTKVQTHTQRKAKPPQSRNARRAPRNERGQFVAKKVEPNQRGSFADKHRHRLAAERGGR